MGTVKTSAMYSESGSSILSPILKAGKGMVGVTRTSAPPAERALSAGGADVLVTPTMPFPAFRIGERIEDPLSLYMADVFTVPINLAGVPAISMPCGFAGGLPIGLQIIGRHFDEKTVFRAAKAFEDATPYHETVPKEVA